MRKKLLAITMAVIMVFTCMSAVAFAEEGTDKSYPNLTADIFVDNEYCIHSEDAKVTVKITKKDNSIDQIFIDLSYDEDWETYSFEGKKDGVDEIIEAIAADTAVMEKYEAWLADYETDENFNILDEAGYSMEVIVDDNDDQHEFEVYDIGSFIYTKALIEETTDMLTNWILLMVIESDDAEAIAEIAKLLGGVDLVAEEDPLTEEEVVYIVSDNGDKRAVKFQDLLNLLKDEDIVNEMELDEDDLESIKEYEDMMADQNYKGELSLEASLKCKCPYYNEYTLYHEYYDADGEYLGQIYKDKEAKEGSVIKLKDIQLYEKYEGQDFEFEGMYLVDEDTGEGDWNNPIDKFTVPMYDEDVYLEVVIKYVAVDPSLGGDGIGDDDSKMPTGSNEIDKAEADKDGKAKAEKGSSPDTGDDFNILPFAVAMVIAAIGMVAVVIRRRA